MNAFRIGEPSEHRVGVLFNDITERKQAEKVLHDSAVRHSFLLKLNDVLRDVNDAEEVMTKSVTLLGNHLFTDNVAYAEVNENSEELSIKNDWVCDGMPGIAGTFRLGAFGTLGNKFREGHTIVVSKDGQHKHMSATKELVLLQHSWCRIVFIPMRHHFSNIRADFIHFI